jgi:hypothetical protein
VNCSGVHPGGTPRRIMGESIKCCSSVGIRIWTIRRKKQTYESECTEMFVSSSRSILREGHLMGCHVHPSVCPKDSSPVVEINCATMEANGNIVAEQWDPQLHQSIMTERVI